MASRLVRKRLKRCLPDSFQEATQWPSGVLLTPMTPDVLLVAFLRLGPSRQVRSPCLRNCLSRHARASFNDPRTPPFVNRKYFEYSTPSRTSRTTQPADSRRMFVMGFMEFIETQGADDFHFNACCGSESGRQCGGLSWTGAGHPVLQRISTSVLKTD